MDASLLKRRCVNEILKILLETEEEREQEQQKEEEKVVFILVLLLVVNSLSFLRVLMRK